MLKNVFMNLTTTSSDGPKKNEPLLKKTQNPNSMFLMSRRMYHIIIFYQSYDKIVLRLK